MKTRFKLLMFVLVIVAVVLCVAACEFPGGNGGDVTTTDPNANTTTAPVTTTEPSVTTTAPQVGGVHPHAKDYQFNVQTAAYTGKEITAGYAVKNVTNGPKLRYQLSFQQVDPETGAALEGVEAVSRPIEAGTYDVTISFIWTNATDEDKANYTLPEAETKRFVVTKKEIKNEKFGAKGFETFYYDGVELDVATGIVDNGTPDTGLTRNYALAKVDDAEGTNPQPLNGTTINAAGYYQVTITYTEPAGKDNFANEADVAHTAIVYMRDLTADRYQVKKAEGITIDGAIDPAYLNSATISSKVQPDYKVDNVIDPTKLVNPYEYMGMTKISQGSSVTALPNAETNYITLYVLWGEEGTDSFLYIIVDVHDDTPFERDVLYTSQRNAWVNDSIEFSYKLGGYNVPVLPETQDTYPTYSTVLADSRAKQPSDDGVGGVPNLTAVEAQKSVYFADVESATVKTTYGYTIELKIPAKSETFTGKPGGSGDDELKRQEGTALEAGEFIFLCLQQNNLTGVPEGYTSYTGEDGYDAKIKDFGETPKYENDWTQAAQEPWKTFENDSAKYVYSSGNRNSTYLRVDGVAPSVFQLSEDYAE